MKIRSFDLSENSEWKGKFSSLKDHSIFPDSEKYIHPEILCQAHIVTVYFLRSEENLLDTSTPVCYKSLQSNEGWLFSR